MDSYCLLSVAEQGIFCNNSCNCLARSQYETKFSNLNVNIKLRSTIDPKHIFYRDVLYLFVKKTGWRVFV